MKIRRETLATVNFVRELEINDYLVKHINLYLYNSIPGIDVPHVTKQNVIDFWTEKDVPGLPETVEVKCRDYNGSSTICKRKLRDMVYEIVNAFIDAKAPIDTIYDDIHREDDSLIEDDD